MSGDSGAPLVSVIICTRNRPHLLRRLLDALGNQTFPRDRFEVVVVDDGSGRGGAAGICREKGAPFPALTCLEMEEHIGLAAARDIGVEAAKSERLLFTDDDCIPEPGWVSAMAAALEEHQVVAGAVATPVDNPVRLCHNIAEFYGVMPCRGEGPVTFLAGANMAARRSVVKGVGGFGKQRLPGEDISFALRALEGGHAPWFTADSVVIHSPDRTTWRSIFSYSARHAASTIRFRNDHRETLRTPIVLRSIPLLILSAPFLALAVTARIYVGCPPLRRFWWTVPVVYGLKIAWCAGAVRGLGRR